MTDILLTEPQLKFVSSQDKNPALIGGLGCVRGDTKIHTENGLTRICDITSSTRVLSWNEKSQRFQLSLSGGSFPKGRANLYRVVTQQGEFVASGHHQILSSSGNYVQVQCLQHGDNVIASSFLQQTSLGLDQLLSDVDVQHYSKKDEDCLANYADEARQYGQQLLTDQELAQFYPQESICARILFRIFYPFSFLRGGDQAVQKQEHNHLYQSFYQTCTMGYSHQSEVLGVVSEGRIFSSPIAHTLACLQAFEQSLLRFACRHKEQQQPFVYHSYRNPNNVKFDSSTESIKVLRIERLESSEPYFDMQVLDTNNYVCENGFIHHNSGKSRAGTMRLLSRRLQYPGSNGAYYMPTFDLLKLRALPGFIEDLELLGLSYSINKSEMTINIHGYGFIILRSYDNPVRIVGYEVADSIVDELDTLPIDKAEFVFRKITERNRQKIKGMVNTIGCVTTPDQGFNGIVYKKWVKDVKDGYHLIKAPTYSNPYLPSDYIEQIRANYDPLLADMYIEGEFVNLSADKVYHFFDRVKNHSDRVLTDDDYSIHVSIDFNVGGCCATVSVLDKGYPITVDEFASKNTYDFIENLQVRYPDKKVTVYPDASGASDSTNASKSDIQLIKQAGFQVSAPKANPLIRNRVNSVNKGFAHNEFKVNTDKCPRLTHALENQGYDKQGKPEKFNDHPAIDDWVDSYGYFISRKYPINKPVTNANVRFAI